MQDVDGPAEIQTLPEPARAGRPRMKPQPQRLVSHPERVDRIRGYSGQRRDVREEPPVGPTEAEDAVGLSLHPVALLVDGAVVTPTEQREVRQRGGPALGP